MSLATLFRKVTGRDDSDTEEVLATFEFLKKHKSALQIKSISSEHPIYLFIGEIDHQARRVKLFNIFPENMSVALPIHKKLSFLSFPVNGESYLFDSKIINAEEAEHVYEIKLPHAIKSIDARKVFRVNVGMNDRIEIHVNDKNKTQYHGVLVDFSTEGAQMAIPNNCLSSFLDGDQCHLTFTVAGRDTTVDVNFEVRWVSFNEEEQVTHIGGKFTDVSSDIDCQISKAMLTIQMKYYHRYV